MSNIKNIIYIFDKVRFSIVRGLFLYPLLGKGSKVPMIGKNVRIMAPWNLVTGQRNYIGDNSYIECYCKENIRLGTHVTLRENTWIQCRSGFNEPADAVVIGDNVYIGPSSIIGAGGKVVIHKGCQIGARLSISAESHIENDNNKDFVSGDVSRKGVEIEENTWIGNNVTILDGVKIGKNCVVGAGAIVTKSIEPYSVAVGNPAKIIKKIK